MFENFPCSGVKVLFLKTIKIHTCIHIYPLFDISNARIEVKVLHWAIQNPKSWARCLNSLATSLLIFLIHIWITYLRKIFRTSLFHNYIFPRRILLTYCMCGLALNTHVWAHPWSAQPFSLINHPWFQHYIYFNTRQISTHH